MLDVGLRVINGGRSRGGGRRDAPPSVPGGFILVSCWVSFFEAFSERCFLVPGVAFDALLELKMVQYPSKF